jgi:hypothetical protein
LFPSVQLSFNLIRPLSLLVPQSNGNYRISALSLVETAFTGEMNLLIITTVYVRWTGKQAALFFGEKFPERA